MNAKRILAIAASLALLVAAVWAMTTPPPPRESAVPPLPAPARERAPDIDLSAMSGTMVYSKVYDMVMRPAAHRGKVVRMKGAYRTVLDDASGKRYHGCLIADAAGCCQQGIEFEPAAGPVWPQDFPKEGGAIVVQGVFDSYEEGGQTYFHLRDAHFSFPRR